MPTFCPGCDILLAAEGEDPPEGACYKCGTSGTVWYAPGKEFELRIVCRSGSLIPGTRKRITKSYEGDSFFAQDGRMHYITRHIDKRSNTYYERIIDKESGAVIREVSEPLSEHLGHGSARSDRMKPPRGRAG